MPTPCRMKTCSSSSSRQTTGSAAEDRPAERVLAQVGQVLSLLIRPGRSSLPNAKHAERARAPLLSSCVLSQQPARLAVLAV
jgi:hypothetical protein